jgi:bifunctional enzyme CysN/CysC
VRSLTSAGRAREEVFAPMAVTVTLEDEIDVSRGDLLARPYNAPALENELECMLVWMASEPLEPGRALLVKHGTATVPARVAELRYRLDVVTLRSEPAERLALNEIGRARLECARRLAADPYDKNRRTGAFILIDRLSNATVAAGMVLERTPAERALARRRASDAGTNLRPGGSSIGADERARRTGQAPFAVWLTGLPRSGKSSIAYAAERELFARGLHALVLDGELLRRGLSSDLGFSPADRAEHVRRAAELARLFQEQGLIPICALVSPTSAERARARALAGPGRFLEVFCDAPLEVCEARDREGLYRRARAGELADVTGVDQPYEVPAAPDLRLDTVRSDADANVARLLEELERRGWLARP